MVKLSKLYTGNGDKGSTHLIGGKLVKKNSLRVECFGTVDELNGWLGAIRTELGLLPALNSTPLGAHMEVIQNELFDLGSLLACEPGFDLSKLPSINEAHVQRLEIWIDDITAEIGELRSFVLPGGSRLNVAYHQARTVCRRAERRVLELHEAEEVNAPHRIYLNRLSDYLFGAARWSAILEDVPEYVWVPGGEAKLRQMD